MSAITPYRSLPAARRVALVTHAISTRREARALFAQHLAARGGGFRAAVVQSWPAERLAREVVRLGAETPHDELDLMQTLYVEVDPSVQITFLDAAGVQHERGVIPEALATPYANADGVRRGAQAVRDAHGEDGERYLRTLARYAADAWPGIHDAAAAPTT